MRPFSGFTTAQLKAKFENSRDDLKTLEIIKEELGKRARVKAQNLKKQVEERIGKIRKTKEDRPTHHGEHEKACGNEKKSSQKLNSVEVQQVITSPPVDFKEWDPAQKMVIESDEAESVLVEAGPGSGKTAVACARVARLIEENDLLASKILLISFTRTAVREIRSRIEKHVSHPAKVSGLKIATLDSERTRHLEPV